MYPIGNISSYFSGKKRYELTNHLGNVLSVISDKPIPHNNGGSVDYWQADILQSTDYSPFGVALSGRNFGDTSYVRGFNGQLKDDEISGKNNSYSAEFWEYSPRLGKRWNIDPKPNASISPYATFGNNPILFSDVKGDTVKLEGSKRDIKSFVRQLSKASGNKLSVTKDNILFNKKSVYNEETTKKKSSILSELTSAIIGDKETFTFTLKRNVETAYFDNYDTGDIDVGDFSKSDRIFKAGQFAHIFIERMSNNPDYSVENRTDENYKESHDWGMIVEGAVVTTMLKLEYAYPEAKSMPEKETDYYGNVRPYFWEITKYGKAMYGGKRTARGQNNYYKPGGNIIGKMKRVR